MSDGEWYGRKRCAPNEITTQTALFVGRVRQFHVENIAFFGDKHRRIAWAT